MKKEIWDAVAGIDERFILEAAEVQRQSARKQSFSGSGIEKIRATTRRWSWGKAAVIVFCLGLTAAGVSLLFRLAPWSTGEKTPGTVISPVTSSPIQNSTGPSHTSSDSTRPAAHIDSGMDEEIQAAIDAHETKRFWRVEKAGSFPETVSVWSFDLREDTSLWSELREGLLADVTDYSEKTENDFTFCRFGMDEREVEARIHPDAISLTFLTSNRAKAFGEKLADYLSNAVGKPILDRVEEHTQGRTLSFTPELEGLPLDQHYSIAGGFSGRCGVWVNGKTANISWPMQNLRVSEQLSADRLLSSEEVRETLLFMNLMDDESHGYQSVSVYQTCQPVYMADAVTETIRPAWRVSGKQYIYMELDGDGEYTTVLLEILVDALTGNVFYAEGVSNGL